MAAILVVALVGASACSHRSGRTKVAPSPTSTTNPTSTKGQAQLADSLANGVFHAPTHEARVNAVLAVMGALGIGVYTGDGQALVSGGERGPNDYYLYDFEVENIAQAIDANRMVDGPTVGDHIRAMADVLAKANVGPGGKGLPDAKIAAVLADTTHASLTAPDESSSLPLLIVRDLGLQHNPAYDTASGAALADVQFDALQQALLMSDLIEATISAEPGQPAAATSTGIAGGQTATNAGPRLVSFIADGGFNGKGFGKVGKFVIGLLGTIKGVKPGQLLTLLIEMVELEHAIELGIAVEFKRVDKETVNNTQLGPPGTPPNPQWAGHALQLTVVLNMLWKEPEAQITAGQLFGVEFPKAGPIPGIPIHWDSLIGDYNRLKTYGSIVREDSVTDADGKATFVLQPRDEDWITTLGEPQQDLGTMHATADLLSKLGSILGSVQELTSTFNPRSVGFGWIVTYHKRPQLQLDYDVISTANYQASYNGPPESGTYKENRLIDLSGHAPLAFDEAGTQGSGLGQVDWLSSSWNTADDATGPNQAGQMCNTDEYLKLTGTTPATINVKSLTVGPVTPGQSVVLPPLSLDVFIESATETWHEDFAGNGCAGSVSLDYTRTAFEDELTNFHQQTGGNVQETAPSTSSTAVEVTFDTGWQPGTGSTVAHRTFKGTYQPINPGGTSAVGATASFVEDFALVITNSNP